MTYAVGLQWKLQFFEGPPKKPERTKPAGGAQEAVDGAGARTGNVCVCVCLCVIVCVCVFVCDCVCVCVCV